MKIDHAAEALRGTYEEERQVRMQDAQVLLTFRDSQHRIVVMKAIGTSYVNCDVCEGGTRVEAMHYHSKCSHGVCGGCQANLRQESGTDTCARCALEAANLGQPPRSRRRMSQPEIDREEMEPGSANPNLQEEAVRQQRLATGIEPSGQERGNLSNKAVGDKQPRGRAEEVGTPQQEFETRGTSSSSGMRTTEFIRRRARRKQPCGPRVDADGAINKVRRVRPEGRGPSTSEPSEAPEGCQGSVAEVRRRIVGKQLRLETPQSLKPQVGIKRPRSMSSNVRAVSRRESDGCSVAR